MAEDVESADRADEHAPLVFSPDDTRRLPNVFDDENQSVP